MILSDTSIRELIESGEIMIQPEFDMKNIRPAGIRLHIGDEIFIPEAGQTVDLSGSGTVKGENVKIPKDGYIIKPGEFILASTYERFQVPRDIVCILDGRSTLARVGLTVHCTAHTVDGNFDEMRTVVLEMKNFGSMNILIKPRLAVALLAFEKLTTPIGQKSQDQYRGQSGVVAANLKVQKR